MSEDVEPTALAVQRSATSPGGPAVAPPIVHEVLRSPGQPLDAGTRAFLEPRFGHDFSRVRVHADTKAAESARAVSAQAYTVGSDIVFGENRYAPQTRSGRQMLAHELTHVIQQRSVDSSGTLAIGPPDDVYEKQADAAAVALEGPAVVGNAPTRVMRQSETSSLTDDSDDSDGTNQGDQAVPTNQGQGEGSTRAEACKIATDNCKASCPEGTTATAAKKCICWKGGPGMICLNECSCTKPPLPIS
jgi:hypothetical protein